MPPEAILPTRKSPAIANGRQHTYCLFLKFLSIISATSCLRGLKRQKRGMGIVLSTYLAMLGDVSVVGLRG